MTSPAAQPAAPVLPGQVDPPGFALSESAARRHQGRRGGRAAGAAR
ncbi:hypothetical protein G5V59_08590 [Nocardioides sp. W3-2-3]|nr:hypothetical protein [Nocardioides convexus]NHA00178.1 hypothetical protein [Nocardioides convexus]